MSIRLLAAVGFGLLVTGIMLSGEGFVVRSTSGGNYGRLELQGAQGARYDHLVDEFNEDFRGIDGRGVTAAVFDAGAVRKTHLEFRKSTNPGTSRVTVLTKESVRDHSTMVAGIIGAKGNNPLAKGVAPGVSILSLDWSDDLRRLRGLAHRLQISNHSYAPPAGWSFDARSGQWAWLGDEKVSQEEDSTFGKYGSKEAGLDRVLNDFPTLLAFAAAGNERKDGPDYTQPFKHFIVTGRNSAGERQLKLVTDRVHKLDGWDSGGLDTLTGLCISKNAICVGAIGNVTSSHPISIEDYSGWGPADDGRIKPDLVASGSHNFSTSAADDESYVRMTGTAMATPVASGVAALMMQLYRQTRGGLQKRFPTSAEIKAVLIHTATDAGIRGPDPIYGWGSINAQLAGLVIAQKDAGAKFRHLITTGRLVSEGKKEASLVTTGARIKVTLVWTDPQGVPNSGHLDNALPCLQNDLDLRLISPEGQVYYPYSLDPIKPLSVALRDRPNRVDNVEVIYFTAAQPGQKWKLEVTARKLRVGLSQSFALVVSGLEGDM